MPSPFHHDVRRDAQGQGGDDESATSGVGADQFPLWMDLVSADVALVVRNADFLIDAGESALRKPMEMATSAKSATTVPAGALPDLSPQEILPVADASAPWWPEVLTLLFWAGVAFVLSRVIISILSILRIIHNGERVQKEGSIVLNVRADGTVESGGKVLTLAQIKDFVQTAGEGKPQTVVEIKAEADTRMGYINDMKQELRSIGSVKIHYLSPFYQDGNSYFMPPFPADKSTKAKETSPRVNRNDLFIVRINANDKFFFGDAPRQDDAEMLRVGKDFLKKHGKDTRFILQMDRATSYGAYRHMQDLLMRIFLDVREEKAQSTYGKSLKELSPEELAQINALVPLSISETDMKKG